MDFKVLGPLEVADGNAAVALTSPKQRRLLAALVIQANEVVSTDRLVELVWRDDERPEREGPAVQTYVSRLRAALGAGDVLTRSAAGYLLRVAPGQLDAARFEALVATPGGQRPRTTARLWPVWKRRWPCGAARLTASWPTRTSSSPRRCASRSFGWLPWRTGPTPPWRWASMSDS